MLRIRPYHAAEKEIIMQGTPGNIFRVLSYGYDIPVYQRKYAWKTEQCKKLWEALSSIHLRTREYTHFMGCIVCYTQDNGRKLIIDGQQRITTFSLLFLALSLYIPNQMNRMGVLGQFIYNPFETDMARQSKLNLNGDDKNAYMELQLLIRQCINNNDGENDSQIDISTTLEELRNRYENTNIINNFMFFRSELSKLNEDNVNELYSNRPESDLLGRFNLMTIDLDRNDDPQIIFETLNSTGVPLSLGDKLRNYILLGVGYNEQPALLREWENIERNTNNIETEGHGLKEFITDYLSIISQDRRNDNEPVLYEQFKEYFKNQYLTQSETKSQATRQFLMDLTKYSTYYHWCKCCNCCKRNDTPNEDINQLLELIFSHSANPVRPLIIELFRLNDVEFRLNNHNELISHADLICCLQSVASYVVRARFVGRKIDLYNCLRSVYSYDDNWYDGFVEKFKYYLSTKTPSDSEFRSSLLSFELYSGQRYEFCRHILAVIERYYNPHETIELKTKIHYENKDVYAITVEHIMPQTLSNEWREYLGENALDIHDKYCDKLCNLTLIGYNTELSNKLFYEKKQHNLGYHNSNIRITRDLCDYDVWNESSLIDRNNKLFDVVCNICPFPNSSFSPRRVDNVKSLNDNPDSFTNVRINGFWFDENYYEIRSYTKIVIRVLNILLQNTDFEPMIVEYSRVNRAICPISELEPDEPYQELEHENLCVRKYKGKFLDIVNAFTSICFLQRLFEYCNIDNGRLRFNLRANSGQTQEFVDPEDIE